MTIVQEVLNLGILDLFWFISKLGISTFLASLWVVIPTFIFRAIFD